MKNEFFKYTQNNIPSPLARENWIYIDAVGHYRQKPVAIPFSRDYYLGYQMFFTVSGMGFIQYEGKCQNMLPGTVTCLDLRKKHTIDCVQSSFWEHYWILYKGEAFSGLYESVFRNNNIYKINDYEFILTFFKELFEMKKTNCIHFDLKAMINILQVIYYIQTCRSVQALVYL